MKYIVVCMVGLLAVGCQGHGRADESSAPAAQRASIPEVAPVSQVIAPPSALAPPTTMLPLSDFARAELDGFLARSPPVDADDLKSLIDERSIHLVLRKDGRYQVDFQLGKDRHADALSVEFSEHLSGSAYSAVLAHLNLEVELKCVATDRRSLCDPYQNSVLTFWRLQPNSTTRGDSYVRYFYQSIGVNGESRGYIVSDFSSKLTGRLYSVQTLAGAGLGAPLISLDVRGTNGSMRFESLDRDQVGNLIWVLNKDRSTYPYVGKFLVSPSPTGTKVPLTSSMLHIDVDNAPWPSRAWLFLSQGTIDVELERN